MSSPQRREEKKRRRQKRLAKREDRGDRSLERLIETLRDLSDVPLPDSYPGAADASLERPDCVKFELAEFAAHGEGRDYMRRFERQAAQGILEGFPELDHWCLEEFFWHGAPDSNWNPIDRFLATSGDQFPPAAQQQIRRWKEARFGFYEIGRCADDLMELRELDAITLRPTAPWLRAISLNMGGVNHYTQQLGQIALTYVAPWAPEQNIHCAMGYGICLPPDQCALAVPLIFGMRNPKAIAFPLPWNVGKAARQQFIEEWRRRDWHAWMKERVRLPFDAALVVPPKDARLVRIKHMVTRSAEEVQRIGLYFDAALTATEVGVLGATNIQPVHVDSPTALAFAEYHAYRRFAGPPSEVPSGALDPSAFRVKNLWR